MIDLIQHSTEFKTIAEALQSLASKQKIGSDFWKKRAETCRLLATKLELIEVNDSDPKTLRKIAEQSDQISAVCSGVSLNCEPAKTPFWNNRAILAKGLADHFYELAGFEQIAA